MNKDDSYNIFCSTRCSLLCKKQVKNTNQCPIISYESFISGEKNNE